MKIAAIYADNFRGFTKTKVPLSRMNFLVGENSTGKTSFLKLIELITSSDFWYNGEFRTQDVDLSYFGDVSSSTANDKVVKIGILYSGTQGDKSSAEEKFYPIAITLVRGLNGKTTVKNLRSVSSDGIEVTIVRSITSNVTKYKYREAIKVDLENFDNWVEEEVTNVGYSKTGLDNEHHFEQSPYFLLSYTSHITRKEKRKGTKNSDDKTINLPNVVNSYIWIAPIRIKPKQTYDGNVYDYSSDGAHAPYVLKNIFSGRNSKTSTQLVSALNKFGKSSGLFDEIKVKSFTRQDNAPFSIEVIIGGEPRNIENVGYGVSQVLPVVTEILNHDHARFAIQQPEVHLHPKAQASLGGLLYDITEAANPSFIIETHSDFVIDRYRQRMSKDKNNSHAKDAQVVFFETKKSVNSAIQIKINPDGSYPKDQPANFKKFFFDEELQNLSI